MIPSLKGGILPETHEEFEQLRVNARDQLKYIRCTDCGDGFCPTNVITSRGWKETQISGMCENCFDLLFNNEED